MPSFIVNLLEQKVLNGVTDTTLNGLLDLFRNKLQLTNLLSNNKQVKAKLSKFGSTYDRIDACKKNCMIYFKDMNVCYHVLNLECLNIGLERKRRHRYS